MNERGLGILSEMLYQGLRSALTVCALASVAFVLAGCATTQEEALVITGEQYDAVEAADIVDEPPLRGKVERGAPVIIVETPDSDAEVGTPFDLKIRFETSDGASIVLDSLKLKYGWFDLTEKLREYLTVTASGIEGRIDAVKRGKYKLKLSISDDRRRTGRVTLIFRIVD